MRTRLGMALMWIAIAGVNLFLYKNTQSLGSALLAAGAAGIAVAILVSVLRDSL